jgi:nucleotide-binding universal stress UspA family protein
MTRMSESEPEPTVDDSVISSTSTSTTTPQDGTFNNIPKYMKILVPHDRSEMSDKALSHAIYLAKLSDAEIIILNVLERLEITDSSVSATLREGDDDKSSTDLEITMTGEVKQLMEEKMRLCREAGVKSQITYQIQTGKPSEKIVKVIEETNADLIIMASNKVGSSLRGIGSTARKVIDNVKKPVLIVNE